VGTGNGTDRSSVRPAAPRVSVIIPAYYSYGTVTRSLTAIRAQTFRDFEIIVVNSSLEDRTREIVATHFPEVTFVQHPTRLLPHAARNRGVTLARGRLLVFTDPDCIARPDWLARLVDAHDAGHPVVGGSMGLYSHGWFECGVHLCKFSWRLNGLDPGPCWILPTANVLYARAAWDKAGPFDGDHFCGDAVMTWRARTHGYQPWFVPAAVVEHCHEGNVLAFWRQRLARGREFAQARVRFEEWSRGRMLAYACSAPFLVMLVLLRTGRDAVRSGWGYRYVLTLPVQIVGQLGWCLGEAHTHLNLALHGLVSAQHPPSRKQSVKA
jgi:GT2 family glycosyltransferase